MYLYLWLCIFAFSQLSNWELHVDFLYCMEGGREEEEIYVTPARKSACEDRGTEFKKIGQSEQ